jgi:DNA-directed RNA polymerase subunit alpha
LNNANISTVGQLASKSEGEMLRYRNFGKKSLTEIREKLSELGLSLGMKIDPSILDPHPGGISLLARNAASSLEAGDFDEDQEEGDEDALDFSKLIDSHLPDIEDDE